MRLVSINSVFELDVARIVVDCMTTTEEDVVLIDFRTRDGSALVLEDTFYRLSTAFFF